MNALYLTYKELRHLELDFGFDLVLDLALALELYLTYKELRQEPVYMAPPF